MAHYGGNGLLELLCCCLIFDGFRSRWTRAPRQPRVVYLQSPPPAVLVPAQPVVYGAPVEGELPLLACASMQRGPGP